MICALRLAETLTRGARVFRTAFLTARLGDFLVTFREARRVTFLGDLDRDLLTRAGIFILIRKKNKKNKNFFFQKTLRSKLETKKNQCQNICSKSFIHKFDPILTE